MVYLIIISHIQLFMLTFVNHAPLKGSIFSSYRERYLFLFFVNIGLIFFLFCFQYIKDFVSSLWKHMQFIEDLT